MAYNSLGFVLFILIAFILYWFVFNKNLRRQNIFIFLISYIFYGFWDCRLMFILFGVSIFSWMDGNLIYRYRNDKKKKYRFSFLNILFCSFLLFVFKYYNFFAESFARCLHIGINNQILLKLVLPVGMSFYLFKSMCYTIDIYRDKIKPEKNLVNYLAYISFFPQILAGPIERPGNLLTQFATERKFKYEMVAGGSKQILWGLFKKCVVADSCALYVDRVFETYDSFASSTLVYAAAVYAFQIYADFSGYSDIAIGVAKLFGFTTKQNFNLPYFSRSIAEFWRKWHISLTSWFTEYVYIPLGGSRCSKFRAIINTFIVFLVSGLWHGANWTFVIWGGYHAALFIPIIISGKRRKPVEVIAATGNLPSIKELFQMISVYALTLPGWVLFRSEDLHKAFGYMRSICNESLFSMPWICSKSICLPIMLSVLFMILVEWRHRGNTLQYGFAIANKYLRCGLYVLLSVVTGFFFFYHLNSGDNFIYMKF